jgi:hypothetical protein
MGQLLGGSFVKGMVQHGGVVCFIISSLTPIDGHDLHFLMSFIGV